MARWLIYLKSPWTIILLLSVALFTFWGGPVFTAPSLSQGGRLLVSYLFIPLAVAAVLIWQRRWDWETFGYRTVSLALIKMVITMTVHLWVVPRGERMATRELPALSVTRSHYRERLPDPSGGVMGRFWNGQGPASGFVALVDIDSGKGSAPALHTLTLGPHGYWPLYLVATVRDEIKLANVDSVPHTFVLADTAGEVLQIPLPPGHSGSPRPILRAGYYQSRCSFDHPQESVPIWVFEHPYHALLDSAGMFRLDQVPEGTFHLGVWLEAQGVAPLTTLEVHVQDGQVDSLREQLRNPQPGPE